MFNLKKKRMTSRHRIQNCHDDQSNESETSDYVAQIHIELRSGRKANSYFTWTLARNQIEFAVYVPANM